MPYFPMFIDLKERSVLVVGGGRVALRKLQKLMPYGPKITVIAPEVMPEIKEMAGLGLPSGQGDRMEPERAERQKKIPEIRIYFREFTTADLDRRPEFVIAAADNETVNHEISRLCRERHIPVNVVDDPAACSFIFPALVHQGSFSAGISTGGASPTAAVYYKEQLRSIIPENLDEILSWLEAERPRLKAAVPDQSKRAGIFRKMFEACMKKGAPLTEAEMETYVNDAPMGSVALVGAGCGKADLITVRGLRLLQQCGAVVYDDLIDPELLESVPESALKIYMGKRSGAHSAPQTEINQKLIDLAKSGLQVVRLKGGDPYLFGRGGEEMLALKKAGIPCQEVPGIPSAIGIPAETGIPVTHRGASRGLHIITAHTSDTEDGLPADFDYLAKLSGTLVFLMGLKQLPRIASRLMAAGKSGHTPAAVLSGGNSANPSRVRSTLAGITQAAKEANVMSPAIIMVGEVAAMDLSSVSGPLDGVRVGITGTKEVASKQQSALKALGAETHWVSRSAVTERPITFDPENMAERSCWLVFTSSNGVKTFFRQMQEQNREMDSLKKHKFAVIGSATGGTLAKYGIHADLCPETFTSEGLANALISAAKREEEIILLRSSIGSSVLPKILKDAGFTVQDIAVYDLEALEECPELLPALDYLTFSSASGVELFFKRYGAIPENIKCVCIGEVTARALEKYLDRPYLTAGEISVEGIVETIVNAAADSLSFSLLA